MDSAVAAAMAKSDGYDVLAVTFDYGQRNIREVVAARALSRTLADRHEILTIDLRQIGGSALTDDIDVPEEVNGIPPTYVPARNTIFLSLALAYAEVRDAEAIYTGINAVDYSGYPDCRPAFVAAFQRLADVALKRGVEGRPISIKAPLLYLSKADIIRKGATLGVPFEKTWSCYREGEKACGRCPSCVLRRAAFESVGMRDPVKYE
jgi:7-cyano-7-deazaguanine synthase